MAKPAADENDQPTELRNLTVDEISLVDKAANKRKFLLFKRDSKSTGKGEPMPALTEAEATELEDQLNKPHANEEALLKALEADIGKALDAGARNKIVAAIRLLGGVDDAAVKSVIKTLTGLTSADDKTAKKSEPAPVAKVDLPKKEPEKVEKTDEKPVVIPPEIVELAKAGDYAAVLKAASSQPEVVGLMVELLKSRDGEITDLKKSLGAIIEKADDAEVLELVKAAGLPGMSTEDQVKFVKALSAEQREQWTAHAKGLRANIALSDKEAGTSLRGPDSYSPFEEVNKRVAEMISKSDGKLKEADAQFKVLEADPKLARDYRAYVNGEVV